MTVSRLLDEATSSELTGWQHYFKAESERLENEKASREAERLILGPGGA